MELWGLMCRKGVASVDLADTSGVDTTRETPPVEGQCAGRQSNGTGSCNECGPGLGPKACLLGFKLRSGTQGRSTVKLRQG